MKQPNILFVFGDQHRFCDIGCYGNEEISTPNFDRFAQTAIRFNHCISNCPVCVPMRGSMLTGLMPLQHGAAANDLPIRIGTESIADVLNLNGYHTGYIGKWHLGGIPRDRYIPEGERLGFKEWKVGNCCHSYMNSYFYDENNKHHRINGYEPIGQTDMAIDFMDRNSKKNWGLVLSYGPPHDPYRELPQKYLDIYRDKKITLRGNVAEDIALSLDKHICKDEIYDYYRGYYAQITALDEQFGRVISFLETSGQMEDTIIVYTSDHGDMIGSQGMTNKQAPFDESIQVPLLVSWQGKTRRGVSDELMGLVDLPVSLLGLVGMQFGHQPDGRDLHRLFLEDGRTGPDHIYIFDLIPCHQAFDRGDTSWRGLRTKRYTLSVATDYSSTLLFDNVEDPLQLSNLFGTEEASAVQEELMKLLFADIGGYDRFIGWKDLIKEYGLREEWNSSQSYFNRELL
ncbi:MAG: sulfatase family protein [Saccharofermentanales bacterium]